MRLSRPVKFEEAIKKVGDKTPIGSKLNSEQWLQLPVALREAAFFSATIEDVRFLQRGRNDITDFLAGSREWVEGPDGQRRLALKTGSRADFVKKMQALAIDRGLAPEDIGDTGTIRDIRTERRLRLIFDVQTQQAQDYGAWKQGMDPDILDAFPAQRFVRDFAVKHPRWLHQNNEGVIRRKDDLEFWLGMNSPSLGGFGVPWGPWGFNSGMGVEDVDRETAEAMGLIAPGEKITPVDKAFHDNLQASLKGIDPDLRARLKKTFGSQIKIDGDTVRWTGRAARKPGKTKPQPAPEPPITPAPTLPPAPTTLDEAIAQSGIDLNGQATTDQIQSFIQALKKPNPVQLDDILDSVHVARTAKIKEPLMREVAQDFLNLLPASIVRTLPRLRLSVQQLKGANGEYAFNGQVRLNVSLPRDEARRVLFHEMMHWFHIEGPEPFRTAIGRHFLARTAGEREAQLPKYGLNTRGKKDHWYEPYAGRIYAGANFAEGIEVPTRYIEWLTFKPEDQLELWNDPVFRETMLIVLNGLF